MPILRNALLVGVGGFVGSALRYLVSHLLRRPHTTGFPLGTFSVNAIGCLVIGLLAGWARNSSFFSDDVRLLVFIGLLGGFTTFSSFGYETITLMSNGNVGLGLANIGLHVGVGLLAVWVGLGVATAL